MSLFDRFRTEQIRTEQQFCNKRNCSQHGAKPENSACHRLSLVVSFTQSNKGLLNGFICVVFVIRTRLMMQSILFSISGGRCHCSLLVFSSPSELRKILRNSQNVHWFYMLNHSIWYMYCINCWHSFTTFRPCNGVRGFSCEDINFIT